VASPKMNVSSEQFREFVNAMQTVVRDETDRAMKRLEGLAKGAAKKEVNLLFYDTLYDRIQEVIKEKVHITVEVRTSAVPPSNASFESKPPYGPPLTSFDDAVAAPF
jgi:hypothetical protein